MTFQQEFSSWFSPTGPPVSAAPKVGETAPSRGVVQIENNKRQVVAFMRHCGCPFAEKTFLRMRDSAKTHGDIDFIAVSHSNQSSTDNWVKSLPQYGTEPSNLKLVGDPAGYFVLNAHTIQVVDDKLEAFGAYGLGPSSWAHVLAPSALKQVFAAKNEGFNVRPTESGSRWQTSGTYAIGEDGKVKWGGPAGRSDDVPDFEEVVKVLQA